MHEDHQKEQYFFDQKTLESLADFLMGFKKVCCLCTPMVGKALHERGKKVAILDTDERFAAIPGFQKYDLYRPAYLEATFDLIICDPPFFNVSLSQLYKALRELAHYNLSQKIMIAYLDRRKHNIVGSFATFGLLPTEKFPTYLTVQKNPKNDIQFFSNLPSEDLEKLRL